MQIQISDGDVSLRSVLVLEDEALLSLMMEDVLRDIGCDEIECFVEVAGAREALKTRDYDCAILDVRLRDGDSLEIADLLDERGTPFLFSTGSGLGALAKRHSGRPVLSKPFSDDELKTLVLDTVAAARLGAVRVATPIANN